MPRTLAAAALAAAMGFAAAAQAQYLIVGNDEKVAFTDGKPVLSPPGKDTVSVVDIRDRAKPRIKRAVRDYWTNLASSVIVALRTF